jgi:hypothetical protein
MLLLGDRHRLPPCRRRYQFFGSPADCVMPVPRQAAWSTRLRSRLKPARPYMARLIVFSRLI